MGVYAALGVAQAIFTFISSFVFWYAAVSLALRLPYSCRKQSRLLVC